MRVLQIWPHLMSSAHDPLIPRLLRSPNHTLRIFLTRSRPSIPAHQEPDRYLQILELIPPFQNMRCAENRGLAPWRSR